MINLWWTLAGLAFMVISLPLIYKRVPPNRWYGFRVRKTLSDPHIWYAANQVAGIDLFLAGIATTLTALLTTLLSLFLPDALMYTVNLAVFMGSLALAVLHSFWALSKL
jgi:uncharacterized membrane protein